MGSCDSYCVVNGGEVTIHELNGKLNTDELRGGHISIGEKHYISPLSRNALLKENFSHLYGPDFIETHNPSVSKL